ncbi:condensation domain-containing protein [Sporolactobacillus kofuensis]|uniref:Condensation domain-containing protein n=1 Tax=Sporolactobacillus kofuensis TaxID=269672 RepID=A0ABW1WEU3_9BACL|nr:condensation domain-containing protein [Sporolactobacillus kofuensis]MCO7176728.1 condensation domain-containing protein [Sporolactobacillus kofuensis]
MTIQQKVYPAESADIKHFVSGEKMKNDHYLHAVIQFDATINEHLLEEAVQKTVTALPLLTCRYLEQADKAYWEEAGWTSKDMIEVVREEDKDKDTAIQKALTVKLNEKKGPQLRITVVRTENQDTLAIVLNHMLCDGGGFKDYLYLLSDCYSRLVLTQPINNPLITNPGSRSIRQVFDVMNDEQMREIKSAQRTKYVQTEKDYLPLTGDTQNPFIITHQIDADRFETVKNYAKKKGATINDALFAAYVCALSDVLHANPIVLDCPVNLRTYLPVESQAGLCNLTSNITCVVPSHVGETFDEALSCVKSVMDAEKESLEPLRVYWDLEEATEKHSLSEAKKLFPEIYSIPVNGMTNIGIVDDQKLKFTDLQVTDVFISGSIKYAPYFQVAVTTFRKKMTFSTNFHGTDEDKHWLDTFIDEMINYLPQN